MQATPSKAIVTENRSSGIMVVGEHAWYGNSLRLIQGRKKGRETRPKLGEETEFDPSSAHPAALPGRTDRQNHRLRLFSE
jgi:hypothetical protein